MPADNSGRPGTTFVVVHRTQPTRQRQLQWHTVKHDTDAGTPPTSVSRLRDALREGARRCSPYRPRVGVRSRRAVFADRRQARKTHLVRHVGVVKAGQAVVRRRRGARGNLGRFRRGAARPGRHFRRRGFSTSGKRKTRALVAAGGRRRVSASARPRRRTRNGRVGLVGVVVAARSVVFRRDGSRRQLRSFPDVEVGTVGSQVEVMIERRQLNVARVVVMQRIVRRLCDIVVGSNIITLYTLFYSLVTYYISKSASQLPTLEARLDDM